MIQKAHVYIFDEPTSYLDVKQRIKDHFSGKGSAWTKLHKPIGVVKIIGAELN
jgi:translation initiation factor RLI1